MKTKLSNLPYYGGKGGAKAEWINSILPYKKNSIYVEPFAGMFSVLLNRPPSSIEIINDINSRLVNYARVVRDHAGEFEHMAKNTLNAEEELAWSHENIDNMELSDIRRALCFYVVITYSIFHVDGRPPSFRLPIGGIGEGGLPCQHKKIKKISQRLKKVHVLNRDASSILEKLKGNKNAIIYCDPPYLSSNCEAYLHSRIDKNKIEKLLIAQNGRVAISGYGSEWDSLGWRRFEKKTKFYSILYKKNKDQEGNNNRTEVLWTNFEPEGRLF